MGDERPRAIRLSDGGALAFAEFGDPQGVPVVSCHGFPGSRLEGELMHAAASELGLRVVTPDRPGVGESDEHSHRGLLDWLADLAALVDQLGFRQFFLVGISGGGPFALACAARMAERVAAVALVAPLARCPNHNC